MLTILRNKNREDEEKAEFRRQRRRHGRVQKSGDIKLQSVSRDGSPFASPIASPTSPADVVQTADGDLQLRILSVANKAGMPEEPAFHERPQSPSDEPTFHGFLKTPQGFESEDEPAVHGYPDEPTPHGAAEEPTYTVCPDLQGSIAALFHTHLEVERSSVEEMDIRTLKKERTQRFWKEFPSGCPPGFAGMWMQRGRTDLVPPKPIMPFVEDGVTAFPGQEVKRRIEYTDRKVGG